MNLLMSFPQRMRERLCTFTLSVICSVFSSATQPMADAKSKKKRFTKLFFFNIIQECEYQEKTIFAYTLHIIGSNKKAV